MSFEKDLKNRNFKPLLRAESRCQHQRFSLASGRGFFLSERYWSIAPQCHWLKQLSLLTEFVRIIRTVTPISRWGLIFFRTNGIRGRMAIHPYKEIADRNPLPQEKNRGKDSPLTSVFFTFRGSGFLSAITSSGVLFKCRWFAVHEFWQFLKSMTLTEDWWLINDDRWPKGLPFFVNEIIIHENGIILEMDLKNGFWNDHH